MAANTYDILIEQGATFSLNLEVKTDPSVAFPNGEPVDLTGALIEGQIRPTVDSPMVLADFVGLAQDPVNTSGEINIFLSAEATKTINAIQYPNAVYDVLITFPSGLVRRLIQGDVEISPGVTR